MDNRLGLSEFDKVPHSFVIYLKACLIPILEAFVVLTE